MSDPLKESARQLAGEAVVSMENIIKEAISFKLGDDWTIGEITNRCHMVTLPDKTQIFCFDDEQMIHFQVPRYEHDNSCIGYRIKFIQDYQILYKKGVPNE